MNNLVIKTYFVTLINEDDSRATYAADASKLGATHTITHNNKHYAYMHTDWRNHTAIFREVAAPVPLMDMLV